MNTLDQIFTWALDGSLRASVLVLIVVLARALAKNRLTARWRYALWLPVLAALVLPGIPILPAPALTVPVPREAPSAENVPPTPAIPSPVRLTETAMPPPMVRSEAPPSDEEPEPSPPPFLAQKDDAVSIMNAPVATSARLSAPIPWRKLFSAIWLAGVLLAVGVVGSSYLLTLRRIRRSAVPVPPELFERIAFLAQSLGLRRVPKVWLSPSVASPAVGGWLRPVLLLNATFPADLTEEEADMVLRHELTHIRRGDLLLNPLLCGLLALHWFNPLLWLAFSRICADREAACDGDVLRDASDARRAAYGKTLLKMETAFPPSGMCLGFVGILQRGSILLDRIQSIIARPKPSLLLRTSLALGIVVLAVLGLAKADEPRKFVSPAEFQEHFAQVGMAETMRHTEFLGVTNGVAEVRVRSMNPLTRKWNERRLAIEVAKLDLAFRAFVEKAKPPKTPDPFSGRGEWGPETEGLSCRVTTDKTEYEIGDEVRLLVEVRNTSDAPLSLGIGPLSTIHAGDNNPFSTKQSGTLGITFAQTMEGKQGFFSTSEGLFPKGTEFETRTVVVQPRTTYSEFLVLTPWGPTLSSLPSYAQAGKMSMSGGLMQVLKPDGTITRLEFKPAEITVKAKKLGNNAAHQPNPNDDAASRAITQNILAKVVDLKSQFPILEKMQVPEVAENGEATLAFEHGVTWVLDDPTKPHSKINGRRAVFEKDGIHFRLHFYRGRWEGAAMFIPVNFADLNLWFTYGYRQGDDPAIISAISKIIEEAKAKFESQNVDSRSGGSPARQTTATPAANGEHPVDPAWNEIRALFGRDVASSEVKKFVATHQLSEITKGPSGSFTPGHHAYSLLYRENRISTVVLRVSAWPEESGEKHWRAFEGDLPAGIRRDHLRKDILALLGEPITKAADTWQADGLELWIFFNRTTGVIDEIYISKQGPPNQDTPVPEDGTKSGAWSPPPPNSSTGPTNIQAGTLIVPETSPQANELERLVKLYTDEEAEAFRAKLGTLKYPTTTQAACEALGIDLKRLTGESGTMKGTASGVTVTSWVELSENYWISFHSRISIQGDDGKWVQNEKGLLHQVSIHTRVETCEIRKQDDKVELSIHDDTLFVDVLSRSGIGKARLALTSGAWPKKVVVRLKYAPDKPFTRLEGPGATLEEEGKPGEQLEVRRLENSGFEAEIPATGRKVLNVSWIDAYRN